jgi:hypothetical protein
MASINDDFSINGINFSDEIAAEDEAFSSLIAEFDALETVDEEYNESPEDDLAETEETDSNTVSFGISYSAIVDNITTGNITYTPAPYTPAPYDPAAEVTPQFRIRTRGAPIGGITADGTAMNYYSSDPSKNPKKFRPQRTNMIISELSPEKLTTAQAISEALANVSRVLKTDDDTVPIRRQDILTFALQMKATTILAKEKVIREQRVNELERAVKIRDNTIKKLEREMQRSIEREERRSTKSKNTENSDGIQKKNTTKDKYNLGPGWDTNTSST